MGYKFANAASNMAGNLGQSDYIIVDIEPGTIQALYAKAQESGGIAYLHRDDDGPFAEGGTDKFSIVRVNGAHVDSMKAHPYAELQVRPSGQVCLALDRIPYTIALHEDHYDDLDMLPHDHLAW